MKFDLKKVTNLSLSFMALTLVFATGYKFVKKNQFNKSFKFIDKVSEHVMENDHSLNVVAHRGFSSICNENSTSAINIALNHDCVDIVEVDLQITKDKEFVLYHNNNIFDGCKFKSIKEINYCELVGNSYSAFFNKLQSLEDIFSYPDGLLILNRFTNNIFERNNITNLDDFLLLNPLNKDFIFDIKCSLNPNDAKILGDKLLKYQDRIYIQGSSENLRLMYDLFPNFRYILIVNDDSDINVMGDFYIGYAVELSYVDRISIDDNKKYFIWLVNANSDYEKLLNCDNYHDEMYIVTDNPDIICTLEEKRLKKEY